MFSASDESLTREDISSIAVEMSVCYAWRLRVVGWMVGDVPKFQVFVKFGLSC